MILLVSVVQKVDKTLNTGNTPFPFFPAPLFQNEGRCSALDMGIIFHSHANKTHFHKKGSAPSLILKVKVSETPKWPISIYWIALLISLYFSIPYWIVFFSGESKIVRWMNDAIQILNNWALLCIDLMNRAQFLIQFSFFLATSAKKKKSYSRSDRVSALNVNLIKIDNAGAYVPVAGDVFLLCVSVCWTKWNCDS